MTVYFANQGLLDLDAVRIMGVSVKPGEQPIGYFGTGLKYAIATLLRTGHKITIRLNDENYNFSIEDTTIRGENFEVVHMNVEKLAFTTSLGKNWQVRDAYRELHSNCVDEGGTISDKPQNNDTVIIVTGPEIDEVYYSRSELFLSSLPKFTQDNLEIHAGTSRWLYYRGVAVYKLPKSTRWTYNFLMKMDLTEDRTLRSMYDAGYKLETILPRVPDKEFAYTLLNPETDFQEQGSDWHMCSDPSEEFLDAIQEMIDNNNLSQAARTLLHRKRDVKDREAVEMTLAERKTMISACQMLRKLNALLKPEEVTVVEELGPNTVAIYKDSKIYVTRRCIANGRDFLAITLYEEWIHKTMGYPDESRGMQQFLFDKILQLTRESHDN